MLKPNPYLHKLGFSNTDRLVVLHADDIGMRQGSVSAYADLVNFGLLSSAAMMVPCSWFPAAVNYYQQCQDILQLDIGVHLTLTSEWANYRWRPISTCDPTSGLLDVTGYFPALVRQVHEQADTLAIDQELQAQIERALATGLDITHLDTHMLTLFHPRLLPIYFKLARTYGLPVFMLRGDAAYWQNWGYDEETALAVANLTWAVEEQGLPLCDHVYMMSLDSAEDRLEEGKQALAACPAGITHFVIHPVIDTPELRAMAPDWRSRVADYELFTSEAWQQAIANSGVQQVIGYRTLRDVMRASL